MFLEIKFYLSTAVPMLAHHPQLQPHGGQSLHQSPREQHSQSSVFSGPQTKVDLELRGSSAGSRAIDKLHRPVSLTRKVVRVASASRVDVVVKDTGHGKSLAFS